MGFGKYTSFFGHTLYIKIKNYYYALTDLVYFFQFLVFTENWVFGIHFYIFPRNSSFHNIKKFSFSHIFGKLEFPVKIKKMHSRNWVSSKNAKLERKKNPNRLVYNNNFLCVNVGCMTKNYGVFTNSFIKLKDMIRTSISHLIFFL